MTVAPEDHSSVRLSLDGMTCAACASRIERKLNRLDGVNASVNFATEQATVAYDPARAKTIPRRCASSGPPGDEGP